MVDIHFKSVVRFADIGERLLDDGERDEAEEVHFY